MNIDDRLEFLAKNIESLHASIGELHEITARQGEEAREHTKQLLIDAENIRALARIAEAHQHRLDRIEGE